MHRLPGTLWLLRVQVGLHGWFGASGIPYTGLALVEVDVGMLVEVGGEEVVDWADSLWWHCNINVIKESHEVLVRCQVTLNFSQGNDMGVPICIMPYELGLPAVEHADEG